MGDDRHAAALAARFAIPGRMVGIRPSGRGHINDSWELEHEHDGARVRHLLQRLNPSVFPRPEAVMENVLRVTGHVAERLRRQGASEVERRVLTLVPTRAGGRWTADDAGHLWRVYVFVEGTRSVERPGSSADAAATGRAFGRFQDQLADYAGPRLDETLPGFHDTPRRLASLDLAAARDAAGRAASARREIDALLGRRSLAGALLQAQARGEVPERIVHNDAKIGNVLFDTGTGEGICVVDLDTVMPGLVLFDFGDMVRALASGAAEDERDLAAVGVRLELFEALARGYLETAGGFLTAAERSLLVRSAQVITLEQAARFLSDHLDGDRYYRIARPGHNLDRARAQLRLLESLEREEGRLEAVVRGLP